MNRGLAYSDIFLDDNDRQRFLLLVGETCKLWNVEVYAYCLMDFPELCVIWMEFIPKGSIEPTGGMVRCSEDVTEPS